MNRPHAHVSLITLGVADLARAAAFYQRLGFVRKFRAAGDEVAFFQAGAVALSLYGRDSLARDAGLQPGDAPPTGRDIAIAWNCANPDEVDAVMATARDAGGVILKPAGTIFWGGYVGYFADPDGHVWEVAHNPQFPLAPDGRLRLPD